METETKRDKKTKIQLLKEEQIRLKREVTERTIGYVVAAFGLVAGLAWNDAVRSLIEAFFPFDRGGILIKFIYAIVITLIVVITTVYLLRLTHKANQK